MKFNIDFKLNKSNTSSPAFYILCDMSDFRMCELFSASNYTIKTYM